MLAKKLRLTGTKDYNKVQEEGRVFQSDNFGIAYINRKDKNPSRFGFVVSTKIAKEAVIRNRCKRAMGEAVRIETVNLKDGFDVVFLAKSNIVKIPTVEIMREVKASLKKVGLIK